MKQRVWNVAMIGHDKAMRVNCQRRVEYKLGGGGELKN